MTITDKIWDNNKVTLDGHIFENISKAKNYLIEIGYSVTEADQYINSLSNKKEN
jgi:hypothetical protein